MKLRSIHVRDHVELGSFSVDLRDNGDILGQVAIIGNNGSGKSMLVDAISYGWAASFGKNDRGYIKSGSCRVDFEIDGEIQVVQVTSSNVSCSTVLSRRFDREKIRNGVIRYGMERFDAVQVGNLGQRNVEYVLGDLRKMAGMRGNVILIDDMDIGLDEPGVVEYYNELKRLCVGNQLVVTGRREVSGVTGRRLSGRIGLI